MPPVTNIAAYQFANLTGLKEWRPELLDLCRTAGLKGTILLSPEGINLFMAGPPEGVETLLTALTATSMWPTWGTLRDAMDLDPEAARLVLSRTVTALLTAR